MKVSRKIKHLSNRLRTQLDVSAMFTPRSRLQLMRKYENFFNVRPCFFIKYTEKHKVPATKKGKVTPL